MVLLLKEVDHEVCSDCPCHIEKLGFYSLDAQGVHRFHCLLCVHRMLRAALAPLQTITRES